MDALILGRLRAFGLACRLCHPCAKHASRLHPERLLRSIGLASVAFAAMAAAVACTRMAESEAPAKLMSGAGAKVLESPQAPRAIGPYSQAIKTTAGRLIYLSGQIPLDPATGQMVAGDVVAQTERVMQNLKAVLEASGATFDDVVKTTIFLTDLADFGKVNETYGRYFRRAPPARATVQVAALPRGSSVEIECVAALGATVARATSGPQAIQSAQAPKAIGPYSQAIDVQNERLVFLSGQIPLDPATGQMVAGDVVAQTERVMQNLKAVLEASGATLTTSLRRPSSSWT